MKTTLAFVLIAISCVFAAAQTDEFQKTEFFFGYSYASAGVNFGIGPVGQSVYRDRVGHNGFSGSAVVNVTRYVGIKGDVSGTYKSGRFAFTVPTGIQSSPTTTVAFNADNSLYNFLGGVQIKDNSTSGRVKPFAHAMIGAARRNNKLSGGGFACITIIPCPASTRETAFAGAFGGGLDVRIKSNLSVRVLQVDYNPIKFNAGVAHNVRLGVGVVF